MSDNEKKGQEESRLPIRRSDQAVAWDDMQDSDQRGRACKDAAGITQLRRNRRHETNGEEPK